MNKANIPTAHTCLICLAVYLLGATLGETREHIREAIAFHLEGVRQDGEDIPVTDPAEVAEYLEVEVTDPGAVSGS